MRTIFKSLLIAPILAAALTLSACSGAAVNSNESTVKSDKSSSAAKPSETKKAEDKPGDSINSPARSGSSVSITDPMSGTYDVTFSDFNADATSAIAAANMFNDPAPQGQKYVTVNVSVKNTRTDGQTLSPSLAVYNTTLIVDGQSYSAATVVPPGTPINSAADVAPGATATGALVFAVPSAATTAVASIGGKFISL